MQCTLGLGGLSTVPRVSDLLSCSLEVSFSSLLYPTTQPTHCPPQPKPKFPKKNVGIASWNCRALLLVGPSNVKRLRKKLGYLERILQMSAIVSLQEVHGNEFLLEELAGPLIKRMGFSIFITFPVTRRRVVRFTW